MPTGSTLTTTSYAVLGLLAVRAWTPYEMTQQMQRSLSRFWPRTVSKLSEEPKKGLEVFRRLRAIAQIPVVMLTALGDETDRLVGLELGADDCITRPFSPRS